MLRSSGSGSSPERLAGGAFCCVEYVEQYGIGWLRGRSGRARVGPVPRGDRPRPERSASAVMSPAGGSVPISRRKSQWIRPQETSARSEEHTSELQSRSHLVCRLLPENKKLM